MVRRLRWRKTVDRALLGPSTRALECDSLLPLLFGGSLLRVRRKQASGKAAAQLPALQSASRRHLLASCETPTRRGRPRASHMARKEPLTNYAQYSRLFNGAGRFCHALERSRMTPRGFFLKRHNVAARLCYDGVVTSKLTELRGNVIENKSLHFLEWGQSGNVYENKGDSSRKRECYRK